MSYQYPRLGRICKKTVQGRKRCRICDLKAAWTRDVEVSYMRGDDDSYGLCEAHKRASLEDILRGRETCRE
jgi:hypothetical protein